MTNIINKVALTAAKGSDMIADFENVTVGESGIVTLFSMAVVFFSLLAISFLIDLIRITLSGKDKKSEPAKTTNVPAPTPVATPAPVAVQEDDTELVAVITAAIAAMTGTSSNGLVVRNIRRIQDSDTAWSKTGKIELMR